MSNVTAKSQLPKRDYKSLEWEAMVLYIKNRLSPAIICKQLHLSKSVLYSWVKKGRWSELRPGGQNPTRESEKYILLRKQAMVLYIKDGVSAEAISQRLNVSIPTLHKWSKGGAWLELRPDREILSEYKAAAMYVEKGMTTGEISHHLSVSELTVKMWVDLNGWNAARLVNDAPKMVIDVLTGFMQHFESMFPNCRYEAQIAINDFLTNINPKK
jgi:transposase